MNFDDGYKRAAAHERIDQLLARYGLEKHPRSAAQYMAIDELAASEQVRGAAKRALNS